MQDTEIIKLLENFDLKVIAEAKDADKLKNRVIEIMKSQSSSSPSNIQRQLKWWRSDKLTPKSLIKYPEYAVNCNLLIKHDGVIKIGFYKDGFFFSFDDIDEFGDFEYPLSGEKIWTYIPQPQELIEWLRERLRSESRGKNV